MPLSQEMFPLAEHRERWYEVAKNLSPDQIAMLPVEYRRLSKQGLTHLAARQDGLHTGATCDEELVTGCHVR